MKSYLILFTTLLITISLLSTHIKSEAVCTEYELARELKEDLADNGKLDCLRESVDTPGETPEEKGKRKRAMWNGECSFESENENFPWEQRIQKNYELVMGNAGVNGTPQMVNQPDQADMCEIIRLLIANNAFPEIGRDVTSINKDIVNYIDCVGQGGICAATASSFNDPKGWYIFLDGQSMRFNDLPEYQPKNEDTDAEENNTKASEE